MDVVKEIKAERLRKKGIVPRTPRASGRGRGGAGGRGRGAGDGGRGAAGRGKGRGRGQSRANKSIAQAVEDINMDEGDDLCNQALISLERENHPLMKKFQEVNALTSLQEFGFNTYTGGQWIYPTNRPVRDYQFDIVQTSLFHNTLVSLPTGLGKTFISAVVMYNLSRWYPSKLIIFMAPTRHLVTQQLEACQNTVAIPPDDMVELTGQISSQKRMQLWKEKKVFFLTPHVMQSDLEKSYFNVEDVRCIVVDEAHKALGNHANVIVIDKIAEKNKLFRVLALSATPGNDLGYVEQVFRNLLISKVELRSEDSPDILPYIHEKAKELRVVHLTGFIKEVYNKICVIFQEYSNRLIKDGALYHRGGVVPQFQLLKARESFRRNVAPTMPSYKKTSAEMDYCVCISLSHAIEMLNTHGICSFYTYIMGVLDKKKGNMPVVNELRKNEQLQDLMFGIQAKMKFTNENIANVSNRASLYQTIGGGAEDTFVELNVSKIGADFDYAMSHPKLGVLKEIISEHFEEYRTRNATTRAIIFSQYRDSVVEIERMLHTLQPMVKPMMFIGKSSTTGGGQGLKGKEQLKIVDQFRQGIVNVLVATCVGEEGLDIGEVDLIVCFDASKSPTRLIQRMGRTGRQRDGRTIFLVTSGKEENSYNTSLYQHSNISKTITDPRTLEPLLFKHSPRMIPAGLEPECYKIEVPLTVEQKNIEQMHIDDDDSNSGDTERANKTKTAKPSTKKNPVGKKKQDNSENTPTITKMFEKIKNNPSGAAKKLYSESIAQDKEETNCVEPDPDIEVLEEFADPGLSPPQNMSPVMNNEVNQFGVAPTVGEAHRETKHTSAVLKKLFDIEEDHIRREWMPCRPQLPEVQVPKVSVTDILGSSSEESLRRILLTPEELGEMIRSIRNREYFNPADNSEYCPCGNLRQSIPSLNKNFNHEGNNNVVKNNVPLAEDDSSTDFDFSEVDKNLPKENVKPAIMQPPTARPPPSPFAGTSKSFVASPALKRASALDGSSRPWSSSSSSKSNSEDKQKAQLQQDDSSTDFTDFSEADVVVEVAKTSPVGQPRKSNDLEMSAKPKPQAKSSALDNIFKPWNSSTSKSNIISVNPPPPPAKELQQHTKEPSVYETTNLASKSPSWPSLSDEESIYEFPGTPPEATNTNPFTQELHKLKLGSDVDSETMDQDEVDPRICFKQPDQDKVNSTLKIVFKENPRPKKSPPPKQSNAGSAKPTKSQQSSQKPKFKFVKKSDLKPDLLTDEKIIEKLQNDNSFRRSSSKWTSFIKSPPKPAQPSPQNKILTNLPARFKFSKDSQVTRNATTSKPFVDDFDENDSGPAFKSTPIRDLPLSKRTQPSTSKQQPVIKKAAQQCLFPPTLPTPGTSLERRHEEPIFKSKPINESYTDSFQVQKKFQFSRPREKTVELSSRSEDEEDFKSTKKSNVDLPRKPQPVKQFQRSKSPFPFRENQTVRISEDEDDDFKPPRRSTTPSFLQPNHPTPPKRSNDRQKISKPKVPSNPYVYSQAVEDESDLDDSYAHDDSEEHNEEDMDKFDSSFVDEESFHVSDTQQAMYLKSVRDAPGRFGRIEQPLSPKYYGTNMDTTDEPYDKDDSFYAEDDDVEFEDVGVFTQAMNQAKIDLASAAGSSRPQTRRNKLSGETSSKTRTSQKQRRRIVAVDLDDSSEDE